MAAVTPKRKWAEAQRKKYAAADRARAASSSSGGSDYATVERGGAYGVSAAPPPTGKRGGRYGARAALNLSQYLLPAVTVVAISAVAVGGFTALRNLVAGIGSGKSDGKGDVSGFLPSLPSARATGAGVADAGYDALAGAGRGVWDFYSGVWDAGQQRGHDARDATDSWLQSIRFPFDLRPFGDPADVPVVVPDGSSADALDSYLDHMSDWVGSVPSVVPVVDHGEYRDGRGGWTYAPGQPD